MPEGAAELTTDRTVFTSDGTESRAAVPSGVLLSPAGCPPGPSSARPPPSIGRLGPCPRPAASGPRRSRGRPRPCCSCSSRWRSPGSPARRRSCSGVARSSRSGASAPVAWAWAAMVPAGALATTRAFSAILPTDAGAACEAFGAPRVAWAVAEALVVLVTFTALAVALRTRRASVGLRRPPGGRSPRRVGFGALAVGERGRVSVLGRSVPGPGAGGDPSTAAFVTAVLLGAAAIALAEELAFRGVLQHWLTRTVGECAGGRRPGRRVWLWVAAVGWGPLSASLAAAAGLVAGVITRARTRSSWRSRGTPGSPSRCLPSWSARDRRGRGAAGGGRRVGRRGRPRRGARPGDHRRAVSRCVAGRPRAVRGGLGQRAVGDGGGDRVPLPAPGDRRARRRARDRGPAVPCAPPAAADPRADVDRPSGRRLPVAVLRRAAAARHRARRRTARRRPRGVRRWRSPGSCARSTRRRSSRRSDPGWRATRWAGPT